MKGDIRQQTQQVLENIKGLLESQELEMKDVIKVNSRSGKASRKCGVRNRSHRIDPWFEINDFERLDTILKKISD